MIRSWIAFWCAALAGLLSIILWKNWKLNKLQSWKWITAKSVIDWVLILSSAIWLPPLLIAWAGLWVTRPIKHPALRATVGVLAGIVFALCSLEALEVLVLFSVFSIDSVTGADGFLGHWRRIEEEDERQLCRRAA